MSEDKVVKMEDLEEAAAREIERRIAELGLDAPVRTAGLTGEMTGPARQKASVSSSPTSSYDGPAQFMAQA